MPKTPWTIDQSAKKTDWNDTARNKTPWTGESSVNKTIFAESPDVLALIPEFNDSTIDFDDVDVFYDGFDGAATPLSGRKRTDWGDLARNKTPWT